MSFARRSWTALALAAIAVVTLVFVRQNTLRIAVATPSVDWAIDGQVVIDAVGDTATYDSMEGLPISDGGGNFGYFYRSDSDGSLRGQLVDGSGTSLWDPQGEVIASGSSYGRFLAVSDDAGGFIGVWVDTGVPDIFALRVDGTGAPLWGAPVALSTTGSCSGGTSFGAAVSDGTGGVLVSWGNVGAHVCVQRLDAAGTRLWGATAADIATDIVTEPLVTADDDGSGDAFVTWLSNTPPQLVTAIHLDATNGAPSAGCAPTGFEIKPVVGNQRPPSMISSGAGAAIVAIEDFDGLVFPDFDLYAFRVRDDCTLDSGWPVGGAVVGAHHPQRDLISGMVSDGSGGAVIAFGTPFENLRLYADRVSGVDGSSVWGGNSDVSPNTNVMGGTPILSGGDFLVAFRDVNAGGGVTPFGVLQRFDGATGDVAGGFPASGITVVSGHYLFDLSATSDAGGGAVLAMNVDTGNGDVWGQRVSGTGTALWSSLGVPVGNSFTTGSVVQTNPAVMVDASGNSVIVWNEFRNFSESDVDIYAQKFDPSGAPLWAAGGVPVTTMHRGQGVNDFFTDGANFYIAFSDDSSATGSDVYVQKLGYDGAPLWGADGAVLSTASYYQDSARIVSDGVGGVIGTWRDGRSGSQVDVYANRIDSTGVPLWGADGTVINDAAGGISDFLYIVRDGAGGAFIAWNDIRAGTHVYYQRVDSDGISQFVTNGVAITASGTSEESLGALVSDGAGGFLVCWMDGRDSGTNGADIYAQRIDADGGVHAGWIPSGVALVTAPGDQTPNTATWYLQQGVSDGASGAIFAWLDPVSGDVFAERIDGDGNTLWATDGVSISSGAGATAFGMTGDGVGGAAFTWELSGDIYATQLDASDGSPQWGPTLTISSAADAQGAPIIAHGSFVVAWNDFRTDGSTSDIYAQHLGGLPPTGHSPLTSPAPGPVCGNAICEAGENVGNCPTDCLAPAALLPPGKPIIERVSPLQIRVRLDTGGNSASARYAVQDSLSGLYAEGSGALGATPVFQTFSERGGSDGFLVDIRPNTRYRFRVIARLTP